MSQAPGLLPDPIHAAINYYLEPPNGEPYPIIIQHRAHARKQKYDTHLMPIHDMRLASEKFDLDVHGFQLVKYTGSAGLREETFDDEQKIRTDVYDEVKELVKKNTGATHVHIFNHVLRREPHFATEIITEDTPDMEKCKISSPAMWAHIDMSYKGAYNVIDRFPPPTGQTLRNKAYKNHWAFLNVWKPLKPVTREPLALCDARSVSETDLRPVTLRVLAEDNHVSGVEIDIHTWYVAYNERHRWWWLRGQEVDECLVFKQYDSERDGRAVRTPHCAFQMEEDRGPPRESIEFRCFVLWEEGEGKV